MPKPEAKTRLKELNLQRYGLVDTGDNPGAHVFMSKSRDSDPDPEHEGDGPAIEEDPTEKKASWLKRLNGWLMNKAAVVKNPFNDSPMMPRTTSEIMAEEKFRDEWWRLKRAFMTSVDSIMDMAPSDEASSLLTQTVSEFTGEVQNIASDVTKGAPESERILLDILKSLKHAVVTEAWQTAKSREDFAGAMVHLDQFELPPPPETTEEAVPKPTEKTFEEILANIPDEDTRKALASAHEAEVEKAKPKPAFLMTDAERKKAEEAKKAKDAEDETLKGLPEAVLKRLATAEAKAETAEKKADDLTEKAAVADFLAKAKDLGIHGVPVDTVAKAIRTAEEGGDDSTLQTIKALSAQAEKGRVLLQSLGTTRSEDGSDAEKRIESAVAKVRADKPDMDYHAAYAAVMEAQPDLYDAYNAENADPG